MTRTPYDIDKEIQQLLAENQQRMDQALADPLISKDSAKLTVLMNMNVATLARVHNLQLEKVALMLSTHPRTLT